MKKNSCEFCKKEIVDPWDKVELSIKYNCVVCWNCYENIVDKLREEGWYPSNISYNFPNEGNNEPLTLVGNSCKHD